jgi:metal-sulfur cluster biosynthetic enzyme
MDATEGDVRAVLREVMDPEIGVNIVDLGLVYRIHVVGAEVSITMTMTTPACPLREYMQDLVTSSVTDALPQVAHVSVEVVDDPPWSEEMMSDAARRQLG